jgi:AcrR family transcriptional regulator
VYVNPQEGEHRMKHVRTDDRSPTSSVTAESPPAPRREPLTRQRIVQTALGVMDAEGLEAVTMRRIGRDLGVEAMSLYNHVRDKEDLLDAVCEEVLAQFQLPDAVDWAEAARLTAHEYRRLLLAHPNVIRLMTERKRPFTNPDSLRAYEYALDLFRSAGLSEIDTVKAFHVFGGYILGYVTMELGLMVGGTEDEGEVNRGDKWVRVLKTANLPRLRELLPYLMECDVEDQFEFGLDLLIDGLRARIRVTG